MRRQLILLLAFFGKRCWYYKNLFTHAFPLSLSDDVYNALRDNLFQRTYDKEITVRSVAVSCLANLQVSYQSKLFFIKLNRSFTLLHHRDRVMMKKTRVSPNGCSISWNSILVRKNKSVLDQRAFFLTLFPFSLQLSEMFAKASFSTLMWIPTPCHIF